MARRGNQQRNGLDHRTSKHTKKLAEPGCANPESKGQNKTSELKVSPGEELPNSNHPIPINLSMNDMGTMRHNSDGNKSQQKSRSFQRKENQGIDGVQELEEPTSSDNSASDCSTSFVELPGSGEEKESLPGIASGPKHTTRALDYLLNHLHFTGILMVRKLRPLCLTFLKTAAEWLEGQRPSVMALTNKLYGACDYVMLKIGQAYPVFFKWLVHIGNLLLLLSLVWLDCSLRGINSFLHMGTTSFFSVICCSIFSVVAMVGMLKFLVVLAIAVSVGVFIGLILGLLIIGIAGTVFLWLYGSFWTTMLVILFGGLAFMLSHERLMLLITTVYSMYCAWGYVGWLGMLVALNLSFISGDILVYFLKSTIHQHQRSSGPSEQSMGVEGQPGFFHAESFHASSSETGPMLSSDCGPGMPSTSGTETELTSEDEVMRLLNCGDHYQALGLSRYENVDASLLKREYRKKAMLVHPDKNMGNEKAADAFKKLQNAYEVLLDSLKRKAYDDELRREELLNYFRRFQSTFQKNGEHGFFASGFARSEGDGEDPFRDSRRIACERCSNFHVWVHTKKPKSRARWCQDCNDFHQAKDGDGWIEQFSQPFLFGTLQKVDAPSAYACADSKIYNVTEWYICQEMRCPANTHKPSFHVNTSVASKHTSASKRSKSGQRSGRMPATNEEETITEEEFFEWFQNAARSGAFDNFSTSVESPSATAGGSGPKRGGSGSGNKRKKKGKKQW